MSDPSDGSVRLPRTAEALLERWPVPEKDDQFWDESAEAVMTRVEMARAGSTDAALLKAPLPSEIGEGTSVRQHSQKPAARLVSAPPSAAPVSLAELARAVANDDAGKDDKDIARESLSLATRARTSSPLIAESVRQSAAELAAGMRESSPAIPAPVPSAPPQSLQVAAPAQSVAQPPSLAAAKVRKQRSLVAPLFAAGLAVVGMAAAAVIVVQARQPAESTAVAAAPMAPADPAQAPVPAAPTAAEPGKADLEITSPEALAQNPETSGGGAAAKAAAKPGGPLPAPLAAGKQEPAPEPVAAKDEPKPEEPPKTAPAEDDKDEDAKKMKPAAQPTDVPLQPSSGAIQAAVGSVLGSARACVAGHDEPSRATIVFGSDGAVQGVSVSGPAAGTPAQACIVAALKRARVQPFAKPTFSAGVTIRP